MSTVALPMVRHELGFEFPGKARQMYADERA